MQKIAALGLLLFTGSLAIADSSRPYQILNLATEGILEVFGSQQVSLELETKIRQTLAQHKYDFHNTITIRSLNPWFLEKDVFTYSTILENPIIFVDAEWLSQASQEKFEFLILREATRIAKWHTAKKLGVAVAFPILPVISGAGAEYLMRMKDREKDSGKAFVLAAGSVYLLQALMLPTLNRWLEYKADLGAASKLGTIQGGIEACDEEIFWLQDFEANCSQHSLWKTKRALVRGLKRLLRPLWFIPSAKQRKHHLRSISELI